MSKFINESLNSVLKSDRNSQNTILFISDAAAYMIKTGKLLKAQYPNMLHITRIAHALYKNIGGYLRIPTCYYLSFVFPDTLIWLLHCNAMHFDSFSLGVRHLFQKLVLFFFMCSYTE
jgi:hypothetical protein